MSAILGAIRLDGGPLPPETLEAMRRPMAHWGPDRSGLWKEGPAGLGQLLLRVTPEDAFEAMPEVHAASGVVVTAAARLDNRAELSAALGVAPSDEPTTPDGRLVLLAYAKWGEDSPSRLLGDWAFAAWDARKRSLFLARDHHGNTALYYHADAGTFAFASCMAGLLALPGGPRDIDEVRLSQLLAVWWEDGSRTIIRDVLRLPPAHCLVATAEGVRVRRYGAKPLSLQERVRGSPNIRPAAP